MILLIYLVKLLICSAILSGYYFFILRNRSFHQYNKYYLLFICCTSILLPLLRFPFLDSPGKEALTSLRYIPAAMLPEVVLTLKPAVSNYSQLTSMAAIIFYSVVTSWFLASIIKSVAYLLHLKKESPSFKLQDVTMFVTDEQYTPFSFFNWIFWNKDLDTTTPTGNH